MGVAVGSSHLAVPSRTECSGSVLALVGVSLLIGHKDGWCLARGTFLLAVTHIFLTSSTHDSQKMLISCARGFP